MEDPATETAKAVQEVAKAGGEAIKATHDLGAFTAELVREPAESVIGILTDRLRFIRWERQIRLVEKAQEIITERRLKGQLTPIPPKLALPIIEHATLEEDDSLQDLWARLLVEAGNPQSPHKVRMAFVEIIKQLEPVDAKVLETAYQAALEQYEEWAKREGRGVLQLPDFGVKQFTIESRLKIRNKDYLLAVDNLMRLRCLRSYVAQEAIYAVDGDGDSVSYDVTRDEEYWEVCVTALGQAFVETCLRDPDAPSIPDDLIEAGASRI